MGVCSLHMHRNTYLRASSKKFDLAICFVDPYFLEQGNNSSVHYVLAISLVRMHRNSVNFASGLKTALTIVFSDYDFL